MSLLVLAMLKFKPVRADGGWIVEGHFGNRGAVVAYGRKWRTKALATRRAKRLNATWLCKRLDKMVKRGKSE